MTINVQPPSRTYPEPTGKRNIKKSKKRILYFTLFLRSSLNSKNQIILETYRDANILSSTTTQLIF